ncbi:MAG: glycosyltransferase family 8 protein [Pedobacter sp.]
MNIAFCINRLALAGLGVTVVSLIRNCSDSSQLTIHFLCSGLLDDDKDKISRLLKLENYTGGWEFIDFDSRKEFGAFRNLHGDWTTYGRLLLPELVKADQILYLDADLVVELDVLYVKDFDLKGQALGVVHSGAVITALDHRFLIDRAGLEPEAPAFNAGILLMDLHKWRKDNLKGRCLTLARKYPTELVSHDQTLLNSLFSHYSASLPGCMNCAWYPEGPRPIDAEKMILHYVGSPKPWDIGGRFIHDGYKVWKSYLNPMWAKEYVSTTVGDMQRAWKIRRSYFRVMKNIINRRSE